MKNWNKFIGMEMARDLSKKFCEDFNLNYCEIYFVDRIIHDKKYKKVYGMYMYYNPPHILMLNNLLNPIGILLHELTHHLECSQYDFDEEDSHTKTNELAKKRVIKWCKKNISENADWRLALKSRPKIDDMIRFKL